MNLKKLFGEDRAVSPVIGVILMVAITVILAAVIGTFVLGLGDRVSTSTPSASFNFDYTNNNAPTNDSLEISHSGGDTISGSNLNASVSGATNATSGASASVNGDIFTSEVSAGSTETLDGARFTNIGVNGGFSLDSATVRVVWSSESGDSSAVLGSWSGPDA